jgi:hypothetical protein
MLGRAAAGVTVPLTLVSGPAVTPTVLAGLPTVPVTGPVMALVTVGTTLAAEAMLVAADGFGWLGACDPAGGPCVAGPWPWLTLWTVRPTTARVTPPRLPPAGDWLGLPLAVPPGACPGGVPPAAGAPAAGPVPWPPEPPGMMAWVAPLTAEAAALVAEAETWFAPPLPDRAGGGGTLAAGTA